jgi:hypothetical protein
MICDKEHRSDLSAMFFIATKPALDLDRSFPWAAIEGTSASFNRTGVSVYATRLPGGL